eukprot:3210892-Rhodomonas_salina.2
MQCPALTTHVAPLAVHWSLLTLRMVLSRCSVRSFVVDRHVDADAQINVRWELEFVPPGRLALSEIKYKHLRALLFRRGYWGYQREFVGKCRVWGGERRGMLCGGGAHENAHSGTNCPELVRSAIGLRARYAMPGTDMAYAATRIRLAERAVSTRTGTATIPGSRWPYAICGTELGRMLRPLVLSRLCCYEVWY